LIIDTGEKRDRLGRRVTPAKRRAELVREYQESGLTQAELVEAGLGGGPIRLPALILDNTLNSQSMR